MFIEVNLLKHKASDTVSGPSEAALAATVTSRLFRWRISRKGRQQTVRSRRRGQRCAGREADRSQKSFLEEIKRDSSAEDLAEIMF